MSEEGQLQDYSVDQAAGAIVLVLGAVASLLLVIWQSRCHCKCNLCYLFQCERRPPNEDELKGLKDKAKELADKAKKDKDKADKPPTPTGAPTDPHPVPTTSGTSPPRSRSASFSNARDSRDGSIEPEPEPQTDLAVASAWKKL
jgi:hypothetical protein